MGIPAGKSMEATGPASGSGLDLLDARAGPQSFRVVRWALPAGLLLAELCVLTYLGDFPTSGPATQVVPAIRLALPVLLATLVSAWIISSARRPHPKVAVEYLPPWRPLPALALHLLAFTGVCTLTWRLLGRGAPATTLGAFLAWLACTAGMALLALGSAAPLPWLARRIASRWRVPLLALGAGVLCWRAMAIAESEWGTLSAATLAAVSLVLGLVSSGVTIDLAERVVALHGIEFEIAPQCSGVDGVGLTFAFQVLWIGLSRDRIRPGRGLLLLPIGISAALLGNVLRISALVWLGANGHLGIALGAFHSKVGWLIFLCIALATVAAAERLPWLQRRGDTYTQPSGLPSTAVACLAPLLGMASTAVVTGMLVEGALDRAYALRILVGVLVFYLVRQPLGAKRLSWSWDAVLIGGGVSLLWILGVRGDGTAMAAELSGLAPAERLAWMASRALGSVLVIPVAEEAAFRGFLLPWIASPGSPTGVWRAWSWPAALLSSLAFGAIHQHWLAGALAGLAFAFAQRRRGRLGDAILAHATCNAGICAAVLLQGRWDLWS